MLPVLLAWPLLTWGGGITRRESCVQIKGGPISCWLAPNFKLTGYFCAQQTSKPFCGFAARRQPDDSPTTARRQPDDSLTTARRQPYDSQTTARRQPDDSQTTARRQPDDSPSHVIENIRKLLKIIRKQLKSIGNHYKNNENHNETFGNHWKPMETIGNGEI